MTVTLEAFHLDVLGALAKAKIATPEKGYLRSPHASVASDIARLARERDEARLVVRALVKLLERRHSMEPWHSMKNHECGECILMAETWRG